MKIWYEILEKIYYLNKSIKMKSIVIFTVLLINNMGTQCQQYCSDLNCRKSEMKNFMDFSIDGVGCDDSGFVTNSLPECFTVMNKTILKHKTLFYHLKLKVNKHSHIPFVLEDPYLFHFPRTKQISSLLINIPLIIFSSTLLLNETRLEETKNKIFNDPHLLELEIYNASFNLRRHLWKLPYTLNKLNFSGNKYTNYELTACNDLTDLDFENNSLTRMPMLSKDPSPVLRKLNLLGNPLYDFTVNDIAGLCDLEVLKLSYYSMGSGHRSCECRRLKEWVENLKIWGEDKFRFEGEFKCADISADKCTEYKLDEALVMRGKCLGVREDDEITDARLETIVPSRSSNLIVISVVLLVTLLAVSSGAGAYFYYARSSSNLT